jgi:prevent-host-death family protein
MEQVNIHQAKTELSRLLQRVLHGEEIIIAKAGKPIARLSPFSEKKPDRVPGQDAGSFVVPDDFDNPLPDDIYEDFER